MVWKSWKQAVVCTAILASAGVAAICQACPVPVFRYAMEFWEADPYQILVLHDGALTEPQRQAMAMLRTAAADPAQPANLKLVEMNVTADPTLRDEVLWQRYGSESLPHVVVLYPAVRGIRQPMWTGPLEVPAIDALLDSPVRRQIADRLGARDTSKRHSTVWVLLESGHREKDDAAARLLERQLHLLERSLTLPDASTGGMEPDDPLTVNRIAFSMLRLSRHAPEERMLVNMLLNSEPDLVQRSDEPMVFPVYGRGLITYALVGRGINDWTLAEAGRFLVGSTSCEVKAGNPGTDMLMRMDWRQATSEGVKPPAPTGGPGGLGSFQDRVSDAELRLP